MDITFKGSDLAVVEEGEATYLLEENTEVDEGYSFTVQENGDHTEYVPDRKNIHLSETTGDDLNSYDEVVNTVLDRYDEGKSGNEDLKEFEV